MSREETQEIIRQGSPKVRPENEEEKFSNILLNNAEDHPLNANILAQVEKLFLAYHNTTANPLRRVIGDYSEVKAIFPAYIMPFGEDVAVPEKSDTALLYFKRGGAEMFVGLKNFFASPAIAILEICNTLR